MARRKSVVPQLDGDAVYNRRLTTIRMGGGNGPLVHQNEDTGSLTQELEKTEQSITLTLQEIDRNFSRANRLISENIIPILEKYGRESQKLWDRAGFWKEFLESSVDVKLEAYEEDVTAPMEELSLYEHNEYDNAGQGEGSGTPNAPHLFGPDETSDDEHISIRPPSGADLFASTPRRSPSKIPVLNDKYGLYSGEKAPLRSPLKVSRTPVQLFNGPRKIFRTPKPRGHEEVQIKQEEDDSSHLAPLPFSPFGQATGTKGHTGILRHQVVDKNWKIQATPRQKKTKKTMFADQSEDDLDISPEPPRLQTDIFDTDLQTGGKRTRDDSNQSLTEISTPQNLKTKAARYAATPKLGANPYLYEETDSSIDFMQGISPPVTLQFGGAKLLSGSSLKFSETNHDQDINDANLIKTPSRIAASNVIRDVLRDIDSRAREQED